MEISKKSIKALNNLFGALFLEYPKDEYNPTRDFSQMTRLIPKEIQEEKGFLQIYGKYYGLYDEAFYCLRQELSLEYLKDRDLDEELWYLVCEIIVNRSSFSGIGRVKKRVKRFTDEIVKPIEEYEILIPILNIDLKEKIIEFNNAYIKKFDEESLNEWGITQENMGKSYEKILNKSCLVIKEEGNNRRLVCNRAREEAYFLLKALKVTLVYSRALHDMQLLFSQDTGVFSKLVDGSDGVWYNWRRPHSPFGLEYGDILEKHVEIFFNKIKMIFEGGLNPSLKKSFHYAITWIGRALEEEDVDIKIIYLSTALESLLTNISDIKKGVSIAYRMLLLNSFLDVPFIHPSKVLYIYELRSRIIHGSKLSVATEKDYYSLRSVAIDTIDIALSIINEHSINRKIDLFNLIESKQENVAQILEWLKEQGDKRSNEIADYMKEKIKT